jgi:gluconate:H+ symporter, GntP family
MVSLNLFVLLGSIGLLILAISKYKLNTFIALFLVSISLGIGSGFESTALIAAIKAGFGHTMEKIGLLIIFGILLGELLNKSQATHFLANYILEKVGPKKILVAVVLIGFIVGLPIFCDSGFIILSGILFSLRPKAQRTPLMLALAGSLYAVHCLVPPHPGILAAAGKLDLNIGISMLMGTGIAMVPTVLVYFYAKKQDSLLYTFEAINEQDIKFKPSLNLFKAMLPIFLPILLMAIKAIYIIFNKDAQGFMNSSIVLVGEPFVALFLACILAFMLIETKNMKAVSELTEESFKKAGPILAIVAAGGIFGEIVKLNIESQNIAQYISGNLGSAWIWIPFLVAVFFKTAQGSSTVAIISSTGVLMPLMGSLGIDSEIEKQLFLMSMGAGSMLVSHANDAYFWVVSNFSETEQDLVLKKYSPMTVLMGLSSQILIWILVLINS